MREKYKLRVFENRVLRRIFGPRGDEVRGEWRRLHNKELYALYSPPNIIRVIKTRRWRSARHVARMGEGGYRFWWRNLREGYHLEDPGVGGRIILKCIFEKCNGGHGLDQSVAGKGQVAECCECGNEPLGSIKCGELFD